MVCVFVGGVAWLVGIGFRSFGSLKIQGNWFLFLLASVFSLLNLLALCCPLWWFVAAVGCPKWVDTTLFQIPEILSCAFLERHMSRVCHYYYPYFLMYIKRKTSLSSFHYSHFFIKKSFCWRMIHMLTLLFFNKEKK